ncbi:MAG TPA: amidase [Burkholderiaceae bacterium]|nr:amidase [Burkholderiaceae bacterium]
MSIAQDSIHTLSIADLTRALELGELSPEAVTRAFLDRIEGLNKELLAFVSWDAQRALAAARAAGPGRLHGIPYAVKDVIDTADYPTEYGSPIYKGFQPHLDAACVEMARGNGAVLLGKVATGEFATQTPSAARNPLRPTHTPGGSSSGSAAAVAAGMVPFAFGTQTTGSIVRPAVYCGVAGYKPTFGFFPAAGLKLLSPSQDTIGLIARSVDDIAAAAMGLHGQATVQPARGRFRICLLQSRQWDYLRAGMAEAIEEYAKELEWAGHEVVHLRMPEALELAAVMQPRLFMYEARRTLGNELRDSPEKLSKRLQARMAEGLTVSFDEYMAMRQQVRGASNVLHGIFDEFDLILYPAAAGEADEGLDAAGDPRFGALWSLLHAPSLSFPIAEGPTGLPLGIQFIARPAHDTQLLAMARSLPQYYPGRRPDEA